MAQTVNYDRLCDQLQALTAAVPYEIANLSNAAALLWQHLPELNWVGFYKMVDGALVLYPFQGRPACIRIPVGRGVCGTAVATGCTQRVDDVHTFPGHIACDSASNSEIVIPLRVNGEIWGVLDLDSPNHRHFSTDDQAGLERVAKILENGIGSWV